MIRRLLAALTVLASGCFTPAPLVAQGIPVRTAQWVATPHAGVSLTALQEAARGVGGSLDRPDAADPTFTLLRGPWSLIRDSLFVVGDSNRMAAAGRRVAVTGAWRRLFAFVEGDGVVEVPRDSTAASDDEGAARLEATYWFRSLHGSDLACQIGACGEGTIVGAGDTGIDKDHPEFAGRFLYGKDYGSTGTMANPIADTTDFRDNLPGCNGHGTHVTSSLGGAEVGGAQRARIVHYRLMGGTSCVAYTSSGARAILDAARNGVDVFNESIGFPLGFTLTNAATQGRNLGMVVCGANGNDGSGPVLFGPAGAPDAFGSAAVDASGNRAGFNRWGPETDFGSAGVGVRGAMPGGGYADKNGSSMASPWTCAVAAQVLSTPEFRAMPRTRARVDSLQSLLCASATHKPAGGRDDYTGCGIPNAARAIAMMRGGVVVAGPAVDTILATGSIPAETCKRMVSVAPYTATSSVPWIRVTRATADSLCYAIDPALVPRGAFTVTGTITTRSN